MAFADAPIGIYMEAYVPQPAERIRRISGILSAGEQAALFAAGEDQNDRFIEIWVRKEALAKLDGKGLALIRTKATDTANRPPQFEARVRDANRFRYYYIAGYVALA